jgi:hypothetical protein
LALVVWRPLNQSLAVRLLERADAPSEEVLVDTLEQARDPAAVLQRMWDTEKIPHRQYVLNYLSRKLSNADLVRTMEPLILSATHDPNVDARQTAMAILRQLKHPALRSLSLQQMADVDPAIRIAGLQSLRNIAVSNDVGTVYRFLSDPEPRVVVAAAQVLRQVTGQDFGLTGSLALPQFTCVGTNPPAPPNEEAIRAGVQLWESWWATNQRNYPPPTPSPAAPIDIKALAVPDIALRDLEGKMVRLSQFQGRAVLLLFWSPGAPASLNDAPALNGLQKEGVAVIGICSPTAPDCCSGEGHGEGDSSAHNHDHDGQKAEQAGTPELRGLARKAVESGKASFPVLIDENGDIRSRFCADDLPTYVILDRDGKLRRRFAGFRQGTVLAQMLKEL